MSSPLNNVTFDKAKRVTPATLKAAKKQKQNHQGGYVFVTPEMERARRFLILGSESSFYQSGSELSLENADTIRSLARGIFAMDLLDLIEDISVSGRAPKQSPGLFALAVVITQTKNDAVRASGYQRLPKIARTASALFEFMSYFSKFQGIGGLGLHKAIGRWYNEKTVESLAYQMTKYRERNGFNHARLLRIAKTVKSKDRPELAPLLDWSLGKDKYEDFALLPPIVQGFQFAKEVDIEEVPDIVRDFNLSWEMIPTERLNDKAVWEALLDGNVPLGALIRQLPRLTNLGLIAPMGGGRTAEIVNRLTDREAIQKARIHPVKALDAMAVYKSGQGTSQTWKPVTAIVDALEDMFYAAFDYVEPTNKRLMLALDLSDSMTWQQNSIRGMRLKPREVAACMAMVTARTEPQHLLTGYSAVHNPGTYGWSPAIAVLDISPKSRLTDVIKEIKSHPAGGTDLSLPMEAAIANNIPVDTFVSYTDNENGYGRRHPFQALEAYREKSGIDAKMVVVGMSATKFTIANPKDKGTLDIAGFDSAVPQLIAEFSK